MKGPSYVVNTRLEKFLCNLLNLHSSKFKNFEATRSLVSYFLLWVN